VPPDENHSGLTHLVEAPAKDFVQNGNIHRLDGKADYIHGRQGLSSHGVHIGERIGHGHLTECIGVVDNRCKKVECLYEGHLIVQSIDPRIVTVLDTGNQVRIGYERQAAQGTVQVPRTNFTGSPGTVDGFGKADRFFGVHMIFLSLLRYPVIVSRDLEMMVYLPIAMVNPKFEYRKPK
jgi:hypothetical protein